MILDGFNGSGSPRSINFGPTMRIINNDDCNNCVDCEDLGPGVAIVVMGYGCY